jgi:translocation and assembly module TamA
LRSTRLVAAVLACVPHFCAAAPQTQDPIVPDAEFEAALPPVVSDPNAPLPPIEEFETPPPPPQDPALTQPLPPLATFDVTTPTQPVAEEEETAATVRYRVVVEGLDSVGLEGRFRDLSALDKGDGQAANGAVIAARAREDELLALSILHSEGYYDAVVASRVEPVPNEPNRSVATISAVPGPRYKLGTIAITGPATIPPNLARDALELKAGDWLVAADVEAGEANVLLRLPQNGYPFVKLGRRDVLLDPDTQIGDYTLPVDPGPRSSFGAVTTEGKLAFDARHVGILRRFEAGDLYDSRKIDDLREAMVATGLFQSVAVEPVRTGRPASHARRTGGLRHWAGLHLARQLDASQPVPARRRADRQRRRRDVGAGRFHSLPPEQRRQARPRRQFIAERFAAELRSLRGFHRLD